MQTQTKRYKIPTEDLTKERQLSSLFYIVSSNLLLATKVMDTNHPIISTKELEFLSMEAKLLASELVSTTSERARENLLLRMTHLKHKIQKLISELSEDLATNKNLKMDKEDIVLARRLLRESQRGLATVQD